VKAPIVVTYALLLTSYAAVSTPAGSSDLGLLSNYYQDCPARNGQHADYVRSVIKRAIGGDHAAMRTVIMHQGLFSTGDNEGYSEVPQALLRTLGDDRYAAFVVRQPRAIQEAALAVHPEQIRAFERRFPKTASLYHRR
jgi:hypothetical protein